MQVGRERRNVERVSCEGPVEYTLFGLLSPRLESRSLRGMCVDASMDASGLSFVTSRPMFTGRRLQMSTGGTPRPAVVRWVGAVPEGYRVGVSFCDGPPATRSN